MAGRRQADTATEKAPPRTTLIPRPNTVAHSAGAICCPDEASARRHQHRATWVESGTGPFPRDRVVQHFRRNGLVVTRRWTR